MASMNTASGARHARSDGERFRAAARRVVANVGGDARRAADLMGISPDLLHEWLEDRKVCVRGCDGACNGDKQR